ncbi:hypothetical protein G7Y89_g13214 [Cudoniella acicularis]|uniref:Uncharacterized protein n=1 Tax=Cudoniella acicularis TaxID=354080 RepID=A0A8H4VWA1_9HELO|nr:hypothetical protein G7Y89_g13214 [Cudoniella acicularis]
MPTGFLSLPRELRDEIYHLVFLSPNGLIEIHKVPYKSKNIDEPPSTKLKDASVRRVRAANAIANRRFRILLDPPIIANRSSTQERSRIEIEPPSQQYTSLSLLRVNRQIHDEAQNLVWENNTFYFSPFDPVTPYNMIPGAIKAFKSMGQTSSRRITAIRLKMGYRDNDFTHLRKIVPMLASRSRYGAFKRLELEMASLDFLTLARKYCLTMHTDRELWSWSFNENMFGGLRGSGFQKYVKILDGSWKSWSGWTLDTAEDWVDEALRQLHLAVGGRLYVGDTLIWEDSERISDTRVLNPWDRG